MKQLLAISGFTPYILIVLLNSMTDLGHKIVIQNTIFKCYDGAEQIALTAVVNGLILLPFALLFSPAGFVSDRFAKHTVIRIAAAVSIPLTVLILIAYHLGMFWVAFGGTFLLAAQSAFYSPAKLGYIKELLGKERLSAANAWVQAVGVIAILAGGVLYSVFFESFLTGGETTPATMVRAIAPCGYILVLGAVLETILAFRLPVMGSGHKELSFSRSEYLRGHYLKRNLKAVRSSQVIWLSIFGLAVFYGVNQVLLAGFGAFLKESAGVNNTVTAQAILGVGGLGLIFGSYLAGIASRKYIETGLIPAGAVGMTIVLSLLPMQQEPLIMGMLLICYGVFAGMVLVPMNALIQFNASEADLGRILAGKNFVANISMLGFLGLAILFTTLDLQARTLMALMAVIFLAGTIYTLYLLPQSLIRYLLRIWFSQSYRLRVHGLRHVPSTGGLLLLGNHTSWLDWAVVSMALPRRIKFVMARSIYERWYFRRILSWFGVIPISPNGNRQALKKVTEALERGEAVVIFPEGGITRNGQMSVFRKGFELAARGTGCTIIPFYHRGLWGSAFSWASTRYRKSSRDGVIRDVTICFGPALPESATADEVKRQVFRLSIDAWQAYSETFEPVHVNFMRTVKRSPTANCISDRNVSNMTRSRLLAFCLLLSREFGREDESRNLGILLPPSIAGAAANLASLMCGKAVANLNFTTGPVIMEACMDAAEVATVVTSTQFVKKLQAKGFPIEESLAKRRVIYLEDVRDSLSGGSKLLAALAARWLPVWLLKLLYCRRTRLDATTAILFSSGSEGTPKGVMLSHANIVGNSRQIAEVFNPRDEDVILGSLPLFHAFGLTATTLMPLIQGIPLACHPDPTDAVGLGRMLAEHEATILCGTPTFLGLYARNRRLHSLMFKSLRLVVAGAERLPEETRKRFKEKFNIDVYEGYGTTETTPVASVNVDDMLMRTNWSVQQGHKPGTVGLPLPGSTFRIVDPVTLEDLPTGEEGLILIGGTQIMKGYLNDPDRTDEVIVEQDGVRWYKSGDKGRLDEEGFLTIVDRYSRFAKIGGEMVGLGAVEDVARKVLATEEEEARELMAVALPDEKKGERIVLLVQGEDDPKTMRKELLDKGVEPLLLPSAIYCVEELPRLGSGKMDLAGARRLAAELAGS